MRANTYVATVSWRARTSHSAMPENAVQKHRAREQSHRERRADGLYLPDRSHLLPPIEFASLVSETSRVEAVGGVAVFREPPDGAGPRNLCCRINVLHDSSPGYLVFAWCLALIKGICHVQRPLLSSASACPYVISLFKHCLPLCQVLTVALSTRV